MMIRLRRHDASSLREEDGALVNSDVDKLLAKRRRSKEKIPVLLELQTHPKLFLYHRAIQGHSGGALVDPRLQDNVLLPNDFIEHIDHVGNSHDLRSIIQSALILGGKSLRKDTHAVFFTAVNPVRANQHKEVDFDLTKPRIAVYKNTWKIHQNTVYQTRSNAIVFYNTLPAICIEKVVFMKSGEELYHSVSISKVTAKSRTHAELASWSPGSFQSRIENIHGPSKQRKRGTQNSICSAKSRRI